MSILSGFIKTKKYRKTSTGYKLQSEWTNANSLEFDDGNTAQTNLGAIKGITSSLASTSSNYTLSASAGKNLQDQVTTLNTDLENLFIVNIVSKSVATTTTTTQTLSYKYPDGYTLISCESAVGIASVGSIVTTANMDTIFIKMDSTGGETTTVSARVAFVKTNFISAQ